MMPFSSRTLLRLALALIICALDAQAQPSTCPSHFLAGAAPDILKPLLSEKTRPLCYEAFANLHSGVTRTPMWSAEHLTTNALKEAAKLDRKNVFHAEEEIPPEERAELKDYEHSGYDRGHASPSADMPTALAQAESFSLANMSPQNPDNNRNLWEGIESAVRMLTRRVGEVYIVTGPVFLAKKTKLLNKRVMVPSNYFKAVYIPSRNQAAAYWVINETNSPYQVISLAALEKRIGMRVFPTLSENILKKPAFLPNPTPHQ